MFKNFKFWVQDIFKTSNERLITRNNVRYTYINKGFDVQGEYENLIFHFN